MVSRVSREHILLLAVIAVAAMLRLYAIGRLPPGLYHDEAQNGLDALEVIGGARPIFFEANNGREPLFIYLVAAMISFLGRNPLAIRLVAALIGTLTIPATYLMVRELLGRQEALLASAVTAVTLWHVNLSRVGFRAVSLPLATAMCLWFYARALHRNHWLDFAVSGFCLGVSFYCYLPARFAPLCFLLLIVWWQCRRQAVRWRRQLFFLVIALLVALPLVVYAAQNPDTLLLRSAQVSILSPAVNQGDLGRVLLENCAKTLAMFNWRGDFIPRHNVPFRPVFDPVVGAFFIIGVVVCTRRARFQQEYALLLLNLLVMLMPTLLAENAPHFLRAAGVLPVATVIPAVGLQTVRERLHNRLPDWSVRSALTLVLVASLASTVRDYSRHVHSEAAYYNFESSAVVLAADINRYLESGWTPEGNYGAGTVPSSRSRSAYLDSQLWRDWTSIRFLVPTTDHLLLLGDGPLPTSRPDEARLIVWPFGDRAQYLGLLPTDRVISVQADLWERGDLEKEARLLCLTYEAAFPGGTPSYIGAQFEQGIELLAYEIRADRPSIRLYWQASASPNADYTVFVHWQRGEERVAQSDSQPGQGYYPTHVWRPGDTVADDHPLPMVGTPKAGDSFLVGMYLLETMERLRVLDASGKAMADAVTLTLP